MFIIPSFSFSPSLSHLSSLSPPLSLSAPSLSPLSPPLSFLPPFIPLSLSIDTTAGQSTKSNKKLIRNALCYVCLAGEANIVIKQKALAVRVITIIVLVVMAVHCVSGYGHPLC